MLTSPPSKLTIPRIFTILCEAAMAAMRVNGDQLTRMSTFINQIALALHGGHATLDVLLSSLLAPGATKHPAMPLLIYPAAINQELTAILGKVPVETVAIAQLYRAAGHSISDTVTARHSFVVDRMIRLHLQHGEAWRQVFADEMADLRQRVNEAEAVPC